MICETVWCIAHGCAISPTGCVYRQKAASAGGKAAGHKPAGWDDYACRDCEQGRAVEKGLRGSKGDRRVGTGDRRVAPTRKKEAAVAEKKEGPKVCADSACEMAGQPQPIEHFARSGKMRICKRCWARRITAGREKGTAAAHAPDVPAVDIPAPAPVPPASRAGILGDYLMIDFAAHGDLLSEIKRIAADELRTPEMQVLYWIRKHSLRAA